MKTQNIGERIAEKLMPAIHGHDYGAFPNKFEEEKEMVAKIIDLEVAPLIEALRGLLLSADASWEIMRLGHDWSQAVERARTLLAQSEKPAKELKDL